MGERILKAGWHALLVATAVIEYQTAKTQLRKNLLLACAGWHVAAMIDDLSTKETARLYEGET